MEINALVTELARMIGDKPYLRQIKEILNKTDLTPQELRAITLLTQDLRFYKVQTDQVKSRSRLGLF